MIREIDTPRGTARVLLQQALDPKGAILLGHGAGGSVSAPDLQVATRVALEEEFTVALVEQPYRVAGRKSAPPPGHLDEAWIAVVEQLALGLPLITGGRSSGARVACRTAASVGAVGVLCLAFPLQPPGRADRMDELEAVQVPVLVVQGRNDQFGVPPDGPNRRVVVLEGDHGLKKDPAGLGEAVRSWLRELA
ncbi:MAG TPA: alpha/beta family hydrolase [Thermoleophilaceae bacterium]|nr:alpha/beta family hydrolase [Thermoleophilaceae bacterium]